MKSKMGRQKKIMLYILLTILSALPNIEALVGMEASSIDNNEIVLIVIDSILSIVVISCLIVVYKKIHIKKNIQKNHKNFLIAIIMILASILLNIFFSNITTSSNQEYIDEVNLIAPILNGFHVRLFNPIIEELLTRGIFMNLFFTKQNTSNIVLRIFFSGFLFGISHGLVPSISMIFYCGMGWILSYTYYLCDNNIYFPILIHIVINNL